MTKARIPFRHTADDWSSRYSSDFEVDDADLDFAVCLACDVLGVHYVYVDGGYEAVVDSRCSLRLDAPDDLKM